MEISVDTDSNIEASESLANHISEALGDVLLRFDDRISRLEVQLSGATHKSGAPAEYRCALIALVSGGHPATISHDSATVEGAVEGAADKLANSVEAILNNLEDEGAT